MSKKKKILWAVSSVGLGHVMRSLTLSKCLNKKANVEIHLLVSEPAINFLKTNGCSVHPESAKLKGSGKTFYSIFSNRMEDFDLTEYIRSDNSNHMHDYSVTRKILRSEHYDLILADEAFWLLTGIGMRWWKKHPPLIFITDFIGMKTLKKDLSSWSFIWRMNAKFIVSHLVPRKFLYIGKPESIPDDRFGPGLPRRRNWALRFCEFVTPPVQFSPEEFNNQVEIRKQLNISPNGKFIIGFSDNRYGTQLTKSRLESIFNIIRQKIPNTTFYLVGPDSGQYNWIHYSPFLHDLYKYFAASDFALIQSGLNKILELSALGIPFISFPLDYHFEQEFMLQRRIEEDRIGLQMLLRENTNQAIADTALELISVGRKPGIKVDDGSDLISRIQTLI